MKIYFATIIYDKLNRWLSEVTFTSVTYGLVIGWIHTICNLIDLSKVRGYKATWSSLVPFNYFEN